MGKATHPKAIREVSRVRSTKHKLSEKDNRSKLKAPLGKEQIRRKKLNPYYVAGFIDGEGSFSVGIGKQREAKPGYELRASFEIELRADDQEILERILVTVGCGRIYDLSYDRYGWYPHAKYKISNRRDLTEHLFPLLDRYPLQAKKAEVYELFKKVVMMAENKEHLTKKGFNKIIQLRGEMRKRGKKARTYYGNR